MLSSVKIRLKSEIQQRKMQCVSDQLVDSVPLQNVGSLRHRHGCGPGPGLELEEGASSAAVEASLSVEQPMLSKNEETSMIKSMITADKDQ